MNSQTKLARLKLILGISDNTKDTLLNGYLDMAKDEILNWLYTNIGSIPTDVTDVPTRYEQIQIQACVIGFNVAGAEGETKRIENGITMDFKYEDMIAYIHTHIFPYVVESK